MNNIQQLMQMGQQLQARIHKLQESLNGQKISASSGGGMVTATVDGKGQLRGVTVDPTCVDARDVEMLEDLILAAVSQAQTKAREVYEEEMRKATGVCPCSFPGSSDGSVRAGDRSAGPGNGASARDRAKTALRLVYHLMKGPRENARRLAAAIRELADRIRPCSVCGSFSEESVCSLCSDARRDRTALCVVEEAYEVAAIERTGRFRGLYHVLGGRLSPLDGVGPESLGFAGLLERLSAEDAEVSEIIVATSSGVEGEATAVYLEQLVRPRGIRVTRLARGIPVGSDLEYVDGTTLGEALTGRREM